VINNNSN